MDFARVTDRLVLRRWRDEDLDPFAALCADAEVMEFFPSTLARDQSAALIARVDGFFDTVGFGPWALERRDTGAFIGFTGLIPMPDGVPGERGVEVGWRLAKEHWGLGFATEAAREALRFGFDDLALTEINSITAVLNVRSQAVMQRLGMHLADRFDHPRVPEGSPLRPHVRYLLRSPRSDALPPSVLGSPGCRETAADKESRHTPVTDAAQRAGRGSNLWHWQQTSRRRSSKSTQPTPVTPDPPRSRSRC